VIAKRSRIPQGTQESVYSKLIAIGGAAERERL